MSSLFDKFSFTNENLSAETMDFDMITWTDCSNICNSNYNLNITNSFDCNNMTTLETLNAAKDNLKKTMQLLEDAKNTSTELQYQLCDKEAYYTQREEKLQSLHRCELEKAQLSLTEYEKLAQQQIAALEAKLVAKDEEHKHALESCQLEMNNKLKQQQQQQLQASDDRARLLEEQIQRLKSSEQELQQKLKTVEANVATQQQEAEKRETALQERLNSAQDDLLQKLKTAENNYEINLNAANEREEALKERVKRLSNELNMLRESKEYRERELKEKLDLSQDEIAVLRHSRRSGNDTFERSFSARNSSNCNSSISTTEISRLESEAESLRCVLEMKQKEMSKLSKQNEELVRESEGRLSLQTKISALESRIELLTTELTIKSQREKEYLRQYEEIKSHLSHETHKRTRLTFDNESLQWHLKQRSEQLHLVEAKLHQLSTHDSIGNLSFNSVSNISNYIAPQFDSLSNTSLDDDSSAFVKGVIDKGDSVSWVLEMDDETPEAAATKMVKRAGSFRAAERSPTTRRQHSYTPTHITIQTSAALTTNGSGPNPLSQSMSANSVIPQHSAEICSEKPKSPHQRCRSKSVSTKSTEMLSTQTLQPSFPATSKNPKKYLRQSSAGSVRKNEPICTSSPYSHIHNQNNGARPRTSTMKDSADDKLLFRRSSAVSSSTNRKLITCDTSTLNSGERLEMRALPTHPSVHDLKVLKKYEEIQESAGEAMVSGTNSEDEGCSASSDEIVHTASSGSNSSLNHMKNSHISLEDAFLLDKASSLNGTPMEVSWNEDGDTFTSASNV